MLKLVLAGAAAFAIAGSSVVSAQQGPRGPERQRAQISQEDLAAYAAARIAGLKAGLVMTTEQEKHWPAFEAALKDLTRYRSDRRAARQAGQPSQNPTERLRQYADALSGYGTVLKKLADAQEPLYNSLDDAQKRRFAVLSRPMRPGVGWHHRSSWRDNQRDGAQRRWRGWHHRGNDGPPWRGSIGEGQRL